MIKLVKTTTLFILVAFFLSCEVTFNEDLREYIDDIASRTPLDFTLSDSEDIDGYDSVNMGFTLSDKDVTFTITNNENVDINLKSFDGLSGDFIMDSFDSFTLQSGESLTLTASFDYNADNFNTRVSSEVNLVDEDGRTYTFYLWATSSDQPLTFYSEDDEEITKFDLGNWSDSRSQTIKVKNEGLTSLTVSSITSPTNINVTSNKTFYMDINDIVEITLEYEYDTTVISDENLTISNDYQYNNEKSLTIYAGGEIPIVITDSSDTDVLNYIDVGNYYLGDDPKISSYTITNDSEFTMEIVSSLGDSEDFVTTMDSSFTINSGESYSFEISFKPSDDYGTKSVMLNLSDNNSGRIFPIEITGYYDL